jgi:radical SAM superfamily enzyme
MHKILLVQPNFNLGAGSLQGYWLPYSVGCLWSYAKQFDFVNENFKLVDIIFRREKIDRLIQRVGKIDLVFLSCYLWNWEYNKALAQEIKIEYPECKVIMGGPQVTDKPDDSFFKTYNYVDAVSLTEGEETFVKILQTVINKQPLERVYQGARLMDLEIPSPYLSGVFDDIIAHNPGYVFNATLETNRGCPFQCTFCDWGSLTYAKLRKFPIEKVMEELEWIAKNKIDFVNIADSNFGVFFDRDMQITDKLIQLQNEYGYPKVVDATWYKNATEKVLQIVKKFTTGGFNRGMTLSVQSMDDNVLSSIKRKNMEISNLKDILSKCNEEGIQSYTEMIIGLPGETYDTWADGLCKVIGAGQHGALESWLAQLLENAELNTDYQRKLHGIQTVIAKDYVSGHKEEDNVSEAVELIVGTKYMPFDDLVDSWMYSWMINNFHCFGWSQVYARYAYSIGVSYRTMYDKLLEAINADNDLIFNLYTQAKSNITYYLKHGNGSNFNAYTVMWEAQKSFHIHREKVIKLVDDVFIKILNVDDELFAELKKYQTNFTTDPNKTYPYKSSYKYDFTTFLKTQKELQKKPITYTVDIAEQALSTEEYLSRLYYRRRQGWGKSIIRELSTPGEAL